MVRNRARERLPDCRLKTAWSHFSIISSFSVRSGNILAGYFYGQELELGLSLDTAKFQSASAQSGRSAPLAIVSKDMTAWEVDPRKFNFVSARSKGEFVVYRASAESIGSRSVRSLIVSLPPTLGMSRPLLALRWTAAGMMEASKGFRRLKAHKYLPVLRAALAAHQSKYVTQRVECSADAA